TPAAPMPVPAYPLPPQAFAPPVFAPPGAPIPLPDPAPSSQVFKLPPQTTADDPIRRRAAGGFPTGPVLVGVGALVVLCVFGFALYRLFLRAEPAPPEPFTNTVEMRLVKVEGGTFRMGSPDAEPGRAGDGREGPTRDVSIRGPLFVSATEVTVGQFTRVCGFNPSRVSKLAAQSSQLPVDAATWDEANEFCRKLTDKERGQPWARKDWAYRLPTEAEWEYLARAGSDAPFAFGNQLVFPAQGFFQFTGTDPLEGGEKPTQPRPFAREVGRGEPNKFGLYDMHGNVWEWCSDFYRPDAYKDAPRDNPPGPADGDRRVIRGGSFQHPASAARAAARAGENPKERRSDVGFRVVYAPLLK
ncbi:MAG: formylglycine-generating enzyme family protein, partial [Gemmataceae bacterium]|nr:formylglycine-generating enzyme family protein [Gemmataceae bacterium]